MTGRPPSRLAMVHRRPSRRDAAYHPHWPGETTKKTTTAQVVFRHAQRHEQPAVHEAVAAAAAAAAVAAAVAAALLARARRGRGGGAGVVVAIERRVGHAALPERPAQLGRQRRRERDEGARGPGGVDDSRVTRRRDGGRSTWTTLGWRGDATRILHRLAPQRAPFARVATHRVETRGGPASSRTTPSTESLTPHYTTDAIRRRSDRLLRVRSSAMCRPWSRAGRASSR